MGRLKDCMLTFVCSFLLLLCSCYAQDACVPACSAGLTTCGAISYNLYVTNTTDVLGAEFAVAKFAKDSLSMFNFYFGNDLFPDTPACYLFLQNFMCNAHHPSCHPNSTIPTPIPMCYGMCLALNASCGSLYKYLPPDIQAYFNCFGVGEYGPLYSFTLPCSTVIGYPVSGCPENELLIPKTTNYTGVCQKFDRTLAPQLYEYCGPYLSEDVYVAMDWPFVQTWLNDYCIPNLNITTNFYPVTPQGCNKHFLALACRSILPPCEPRYVPYFNITSGIPTISCDSFCEAANEACDEFYQRSNSSHYTVQNCSVYPSSNYFLEMAPLDYVSVPCSTFLYPPNVYEEYTIKDATCPEQTGRKIIRSDRDPYCDLRCPDASYTLSEWKKLSNLTIVGASLSLLTMSFLTLSYLLQHSKRKFPLTVHFWEFVATALFAISFLIGGSEPEKTTWCYDEGTNATQDNNTRCAVQGFFFIFFGLALTSWCCVIAFLMFYCIVFTKKIKDMRRYTIFFHLFAWGIALAFSVGAAATNSIGYGPPLAWCFIHFSGFGFSSGGVSKDYIFFYIPIAVLFFSILFMFICTVIKIIYVRRAGLAHTSVARKGSRTFRAQIRVLIFIFIISVICFTIFEWRLQIQGNSTLAAFGINWTYCKIKHALAIPTGDICDGNTSPARVDYHHTAFESFLLSGIGILIFIGFGSDTSIYKHWYNLGKLASAKDWDTMYQMIVYGKDPFPQSRSPSNSGSGARSKSKESKDTSKNSKTSDSNSNSNFSREATSYDAPSTSPREDTTSIELTGLSESQDMKTAASSKEVFLV